MFFYMPHLLTDQAPRNDTTSLTMLYTTYMWQIYIIIYNKPWGKQSQGWLCRPQKATRRVDSLYKSLKRTQVIFIVRNKRCVKNHNIDYWLKNGRIIMIIWYHKHYYDSIMLPWQLIIANLNVQIYLCYHDNLLLLYIIYRHT